MIENTKKILTFPLRLSIAFLLLGLLSHILHFDYSELMVTAAFSAIIILYPNRFHKKANKKTLDWIKLILVVSWSFNGIWTILHLPYKLPFQILAAISGIIWLVMEGLFYFGSSETTEGNRTKKTISNILFALAAVLITIGVLLKILHWPNSTIILISGVLFAVAWLVADPFLSKS